MSNNITEKSYNEEIDAIKLELEDIVEDTYVISVTFDDISFNVCCQYRLDSNYNETDELTCLNDSGGDIHGSGCAAYLRKLDDSERLLDEVIDTIDAFVNAQAFKNI